MKKNDQPEPQILPPDEAKSRLRGAIAAELGDNWESPNSGWAVVTNTAYMARLNKGRLNVDFYVDYFSGEVTTEVHEALAGMNPGRLFALMLAILLVIIMLMLARAVGYW